MKNAWQIVIFSFFFALAGLALIPRLNVQYTPSGDSQYMRIDYSGYGLSAEQLEREVCVPLESSVATMREVKEIRSKTQDGSGSVDVELSRFVDVDFFRFDLAAKVRQMYARFPDGVSYPVIREVLDEKKDEYEEPILTYSISAPRPVSFLARYARETIAPQIGRLEGVAQVRISGDRTRQVQVDLDPGKIISHGLRLDQVRDAVNRAFGNEAIGTWKQPDHTIMTVRLQADYNPDTSRLLPYLRSIRIPTPKATVLTLNNLGNIYWKDEEVSAYYRINGQNALRMMIFPGPRANHIELAGIVKEEMNHIQSNLHEQINFTLEKDNTTFLREELQKIYQRTGLSLLILLLFVVLFYFSWKPVVIIFSGILVNLGIAFIFYYFLRIELNLYALAGITVTFGIIIDNSIVMIQHIRTQQNRRIFMALLAATLTTISALIIIFFLPEKLKVQLRYFALVIVINLIVSLIVSLFFVPAFMHLLKYDRKKINTYRALSWWDRFYTRYLVFTQRRRNWYIAFLILVFGLPIFWLPTQWSGHEWYNKTIGSTWYRDEGRPVMNKILGGTMRLFVYHAYEHAGFRDQEETRLMIRCQMPEGSSLEQTNELISYLENYLNQYMGPIKSFTTTINEGGNALINVFFDPDVDLSFPYILKDRMVLFSSQFGGARWSVTGVGQGYSNASGASPPNFSLQFIGYDQEKIAEYSEVLKTRLERHPRVRNVETNTSLSWFGGTKNVYEMTMDLHQMQQEKLSLTDFRHIMNYYNLRNDLLLQKPALPRIDYSLRYPDAGRWMLENKPVLYNNTAFDVGEMVSYAKREVAESIVKVNQEYVQGIKYEYTGSQRFGEKYLDEVMEEMAKVLPLGFRLEKKKFSYFLFSEGQRSYWLLFLIIGLILVISAIHFESFRWPFVIVSIIPLSYIGIFLIFYFTGASFDQGGYTSFILVTGLTVNGLIYLLTDYKQLLRSGMPRLEAYKQAFRQKILPIFLTLLSTAVGLLPFALIGTDDAFWNSLAIGSIGGILFSFVVLVLFTPVFLNFGSRSQEAGSR